MINNLDKHKNYKKLWLIFDINFLRNVSFQIMSITKLLSYVLTPNAKINLAVLIVFYQLINTIPNAKLKLVLKTFKKLFLK